MSDKTNPYDLATQFLATHYRNPQGELLLRKWRDQAYLFDGITYKTIDWFEVEDNLYRFLKGIGKPTTAKLIRDVSLSILPQGVRIPAIQEAPCWLDGRATPDADYILVCQNGLLDLSTGTLLPPTPSFFSQNSVKFSYDPEAPEPRIWLDFLNSLWGDTPEAIEILQEWFGYVLAPINSIQKILLLYGPTRSGKGTITTALTDLVGQANVAGITLSTLTERFGVWSLFGKTLATFGDVRLSGGADKDRGMERLLSISGCDTIPVERKYHDLKHVRLRARFMMSTNEMPTMNDTAGALLQRIIVLKMDKSFADEQDTTLSEKIALELPGILNWALVGWRRVAERKEILQPACFQKTVDVLESQISPIRAFVKSCCDVGPDFSIGGSPLHTAYTNYMLSGGQRPLEANWFYRHLFTAVPGLDKKERRIKGGGGKRQMTYVGLKLKDETE